jgi:hypothetical protein
MGSVFSLDRDEVDMFGLSESEIYGGHVTYPNTVGAVIALMRRNGGRVAITTGAGVSADHLPTFRSGNNTGFGNRSRCRYSTARISIRIRARARGFWRTSAASMRGGDNH